MRLSSADSVTFEKTWRTTHEVGTLVCGESHVDSILLSSQTSVPILCIVERCTYDTLLHDEMKCRAIWKECTKWLLQKIESMCTWWGTRLLASQWMNKQKCTIVDRYIGMNCIILSGISYGLTRGHLAGFKSELQSA